MGNKIKRDKFEASRFNFWFVWKKGWKTFSRHKKLNFPIIFIVGFAIALGASILELSQFRMELQKEVIDRQNFTDVFINTELLPINTMNDYIESQKNLYSDYELRLNLPVSFNFGSDNERILGFIVGINSSRKIHINHLLDPNGNQLLSENATLNTEYHLDNPSIGIGEKITIFIGNENISLNIQNIGYSYEL